MVQSKESREKPVQTISGTHFIYTTQGDIVLVAATKENINVMLVLKLLFKMVKLVRYLLSRDQENLKIKSLTTSMKK